MPTITKVAILGAGPYGLSLAAHLRQRGIEFRIFGRPMQPWIDHMPPGMLLKSGGNASDIVDPGKSFPLAAFYSEQAIDFDPLEPIPLERFVAYGRAFQERFVSELETGHIVHVEPDAGDAFRLHAASGEQFRAQSVVLGTGVLPFRYLPSELAGLEGFVSHSADYGPIDGLRGRTIAVIGAGASAIDLAAALHAAGIDVRVLARRSSIAFHQPPARGWQAMLHNLRYPPSAIGGGWRIRFCAEAPHLLHYLPVRLKWHIATTYLGAAPGWFMRDRARDMAILTGRQILDAKIDGDRITLHHGAVTGDAKPATMTVDHVIAATGYRIDLRRYDLLSDAIRQHVATWSDAPVLSRSFETSCKGLYIIGPAAAPSFGPVMRFVYGAAFTADRLSRALAPASRTIGWSRPAKLAEAN